MMVKTIGLITPGGDAPGMNAAIRAVTRVAYSKHLQVLGFERGWEGLLMNKFQRLTPRSVGGIISFGGTMLYTSRCPEFRKAENVAKAASTLALNDVSGLVVIGGEGSFRGALDLYKASNVQIAGIPATIDNDVFGSDETIGFDTAVNTAVNEIDKIRDTAMSHERVFVVEVMGRKRGFLALTVGLTVGAEVILIPENKCNTNEVAAVIKENARKGKRTGIVVAAEGCGNVSQIAEVIGDQTGAEVRLTILGYAQRGGSPTARSRLLASLFADKAVELLCRKNESRVVGLQNGVISSIGLKESCNGFKPIDLKLLDLAEILAT